MTLEMATAAYACSTPSLEVLRVGGDTACRGQDPCNGPLPSPGPYRVKFLVMGCHGPKAETRWSDPILLRRASSLSAINTVCHGSDVVVITSILVSLGTVLAAAVLSTLGAKAWGSLCHRDSGSFTRRSYRTHHIPPVLPQALPPGCGHSPPGLGCFALPAPCPAEEGGVTLCPIAWVRAVTHPCHERGSSQPASPVGARALQTLPGGGKKKIKKRAQPVVPRAVVAQECGRMVAAGGSHGDTQPGCPHSRSRHPGSRTMLPLLLLLLVTAHGLDELSYVPELAMKSLEGQITTTTFVLEQPRCIFKFQGNDSNIMIWLVVAVPEAISNFNNSLEPGSPERAFQNFLNGTDAYMTLGTTTDRYPCPKNPQDITVLRVGSDASCAHNKAVPTCNGPLPGPGPYKVKFLAFNGSEPVADTQWSKPITLKTAKSYKGIPVSDSKHSAGMIALTTILSILFAILLAGLVAMMISGGLDSCGSSSFTKPDMVTVQRYNTHHVYDQQAARL
ncbi:uncharacterized protein [Heliangelus exortis]|uniref:uncharacterized protein n=1 Tax=Heliangelus exortis TaxID=472823 RepID=UPI003A8FC98C